MSRLIVKNLPKKISEDKIRSIFQEKGTLTDVQLKYTDDGTFRQFAFVGYQTEEEAQDAIKHLNNMFIKTSKITVESCALLGDVKKPKAWSKYSTDSSAYKSTHPHISSDSPAKAATKEEKKKKKKEKKIDESEGLLSKYKDDPMFKEFLELHAPDESKKLGQFAKEDNDDEDDNDVKSEIKEDNNSDEVDDSESEEIDKAADEKISDLEYMQKLTKKTLTKKKEPRNFELFTLKLKGLPYTCKKKDIRQFLKPVTPFSIRKPQKIQGIAYIGFKTEKEYKKALLKDRSFMSGRQVSICKYIKNEADETPNNNNSFKHSKWITQEDALKNEENIAESGRIFVRNLAYTTKEDDLDKIFAVYGPIVEINLPVDSVSKNIKGFATITFMMPEHAVKAYSELDGSVLHGRMLHLLPGKDKETSKQEELEESSNFKKKKLAKQKSQAGSTHNWNSLFLGHDAVAGAIADSFQTSKEKVLDPHSGGSAAVRLALGETQIVAQTRKYLEQEGVILDTFSDAKSKRSKTIIIVKNLPSKTEAIEIKVLFEKFGMIGRLILPPSGITALVEFLEPSEARKAFTNLAYTKFKNVPLYLEWAPENSLTEKSKSLRKEKVEVDNKNETKIDVGDKANNDKKESLEEEIIEEPEPDTTLFVKNLNFQTTDNELKKHFESRCGKLAYATVATKKDKADPTKRLSMGYGFVRFIYKQDADKALKTLQQSILDGKSLELKRSERTLSNDVTTTKKVSELTKQTGTKILVRNIPFQAVTKEISELFRVFGEIKALRLPKKMTPGSNSHRGFGFVDFITASDAKKAFEALSQSTHLYGRRLVLEWASTEEGVDEIRKRTAAHFTTEQVVKSKKSVLSID